MVVEHQTVLSLLLVFVVRGGSLEVYLILRSTTAGSWSFESVDDGNSGGSFVPQGSEARNRYSGEKDFGGRCQRRDLVD